MPDLGPIPVDLQYRVGDILEKRLVTLPKRVHVDVSMTCQFVENCVNDWSSAVNSRHRVRRNRRCSCEEEDSDLIEIRL